MLSRMHSSNLKSAPSRRRAMNTTAQNEEKRTIQSTHRGTSRRQPSSWFHLPTPIRQIFDTFPLKTYDENEPPQRVSVVRSENTLHIFSAGDGLSPNPACLKWQAYLMIKRIPFKIVSANNHASPTGARPFLLPAQKAKDPPPQPISSSKIQRWALSQGREEEAIDIALEAYLSLIDHAIRNAWLYTLYLNHDNFRSVASRLYVDTVSTNSLVKMTLASQLQTAAEEQLLKTKIRIDEDEIYEQAEAAFKSLATKLGHDNYFSGKDEPALFDVTLFSYTHLILSFGEDAQGGKPLWKGRKLFDLLQPHKTLILHRDRLLQRCTAG